MVYDTDRRIGLQGHFLNSDSVVPRALWIFIVTGHSVSHSCSGSGQRPDHSSPGGILSIIYHQPGVPLTCLTIVLVKTRDRRWEKQQQVLHHCQWSSLLTEKQNRSELPSETRTWDHLSLKNKAPIGYGLIRKISYLPSAYWVLSACTFIT